MCSERIYSYGIAIIKYDIKLQYNTHVSCGLQEYLKLILSLVNYDGDKIKEIKEKVPNFDIKSVRSDFNDGSHFETSCLLKTGKQT